MWSLPSHTVFLFRVFLGLIFPHCAAPHPLHKICFAVNSLTARLWWKVLWMATRNVIKNTLKALQMAQDITVFSWTIYVIFHSSYCSWTTLLLFSSIHLDFSLVDIPMTSSCPFITASLEDPMHRKGNTAWWEIFYMDRRHMKEGDKRLIPNMCPLVVQGTGSCLSENFPHFAKQFSFEILNGQRWGRGL